MTMQILRPFDDILAFYDGRTGEPAADTWVDDGALSLGIASYAIVSGSAALVYDTHVSLDHARLIRNYLENLGVTEITVLLSHHHLDHVAGTEIFADCPVWSTAKTLAHLERLKSKIESGTHHGPPAINPLILPDNTFEGSMQLQIGALTLDILEFDIHSDDEALIWIVDRKILLAGDALEDMITYVAEPQNLSVHYREIDRLKALAPRHILPNHGDPSRIASGGYGPGLCDATQSYINDLLDIAAGTTPQDTPLAELVSGWLQSGELIWFDAYERVHRQNVAKLLAARRSLG
ncbi:Zn-dependent hydrolase, glyoxylase [Hoeflea sp. IMCC20628]|uniref:MBL fold metallo-hydrolase n=1 Tax=Hoeflea sp. IMCC20628 TaxID=1620421 RepID=UPI00063AB78A|nr:MBL fold metallo-hydrolase [Hoeflea sp. IMCC20628]AKH99497.1 Zn-dependent hydrolase, glyoxylase [Hoeflea sp. IMCC20628]